MEKKYILWYRINFSTYVNWWIRATEIAAITNVWDVSSIGSLSLIFFKLLRPSSKNSFDKNYFNVVVLFCVFCMKIHSWTPFFKVIRGKKYKKKNLSKVLFCEMTTLLLPLPATKRASLIYIILCLCMFHHFDLFVLFIILSIY